MALAKCTFNASFLPFLHPACVIISHGFTLSHPSLQKLWVLPFAQEGWQPSLKVEEI